MVVLHRHPDRRRLLAPENVDMTPCQVILATALLALPLDLIVRTGDIAPPVQTTEDGLIHSVGAVGDHAAGL